MYLSKTRKNNKLCLVLPINEAKFIAYESQMILVSEQKYFISVEFEGQLVWDINGLLPIEMYLSSKEITFENIKTIILELIEALDSASQYLLNSDKVYLDTQYIFYDLECERVKLTYLPLDDVCFSNEQRKFKIAVLSLLYMTQLALNKDQEMIDLIDMLQKEQTDMYQVKHYLLQKRHVVNNISWFKKLMWKKGKVRQVPLKIENDMATIMVKEDNPYLVMKHKKIYIKNTCFKIGRDRDNDLVISDNKEIGRFHSEIVKEDKDFYLVDHNSLNGTFLNGVRLSRGKVYILKNQDLIEWANIKAIFKKE